MSFSDDDDLRLFESLVDPELAREILRIKNNDPEVTSLQLNRDFTLDGRASRRLGCILGKTTHVETLTIRCNLDVVGLWAGLQSNQCIQKFELDGINLQDNEKMNALAPFLGNNPSLRWIDLDSCNIGPAGINILSTALLNRSEDTLQCLSLSINQFGGIHLDQLVLALNRNRNMTHLELCGNRIGPRGCTSLAKLLSKRESSLIFLYLGFSSIDDESTIILADSLAKNTKLKELGLHWNDAISSKGWSAMLKLVCNSSSIDAITKSNHYLSSVVDPSSVDFSTRIENSLGTDAANLLYASLNLNRHGNKTVVVRRKTLWSHARGDLNLGDSSIVAGSMPRILAWIGDDSNEPNAKLIQYHKPSLPKVKLDAIRLDSIHRILRFKPDLLLSACSKERLRRTRLADEKKELRDEIKDLGDEIASRSHGG